LHLKTRTKDETKYEDEDSPPGSLTMLAVLLV